METTVTNLLIDPQKRPVLDITTEVQAVLNSPQLKCACLSIPPEQSPLSEANKPCMQHGSGGKEIRCPALVRVEELANLLTPENKVATILNQDQPVCTGCPTLACKPGIIIHSKEITQEELDALREQGGIFCSPQIANLTRQLSKTQYQ